MGRHLPYGITQWFTQWLDLPTQGGWKAELSYAIQQCDAWESNSWSRDHQCPNHYTAVPRIDSHWCWLAICCMRWLQFSSFFHCSRVVSCVFCCGSCSLFLHGVIEISRPDYLWSSWFCVVQNHGIFSVKVCRAMLKEDVLQIEWHWHRQLGRLPVLNLWQKIIWISSVGPASRMGHSFWFLILNFTLQLQVIVVRCEV